MRYFDANSTTPLHPAARAAWLAAQDECWQNAASPTAGGTRANALLEECRSKLAARFALGTEIVFTSGATEANNAVFAYEAARDPDSLALISAVEHASVRLPAEKYFGPRLRILPVLPDGTADLSALKATLKKANGTIGLLSLMAVNNETGVIQPIAGAWEIVHRHGHGLRFHCDTSQSFGKQLDYKSQALTDFCDYVVASAHKFGGPKGCGFLALKPKTCPQFTGQLGGGQENHRRAGTVDTPAIAAMLAALEAAERDAGEIEADFERENAQQFFEDTLLRKIPGTIVNGGDKDSFRVWNTTSLTLPRHAALRWVKRLERRGFVIGTGSACSANEAPGTPSRVLAAMGISPEAAARTVRISAWFDTPESERLALADAFGEVAAELDAEQDDASRGGGYSVISVP